MDLRANNDNNNRNNIDSELNAFEKFETEVKNTIFGILFVLLKETEISAYTTYILMFIQFVQMLIFPFHKTINGTWNSPDVVKVIHDIVNYLNVVPYIDDTNWDLYVTFMYIGVAVVGIAMLNFFYVSYAFSKKNISFNWPIVLQKYLLTLFITILYLPFMDYFVSMIACVGNSAGVTVHSYFSEIECWQGIHILHAIFAIITGVVFFTICSVFSLTYYEYKGSSNDPNARVSSRVNFLLLLYKTIMIICLTFLTGEQFQVLLLALILIGSLILFVRFYYASPFHNEIVSKVWSIFQAVNLWSAGMLVFAKIMEETLFEGSIIAWIIGIPFVVLIIITNRDHRVELLLINVNKMQSPQEVQDQIRYLLKMIEWQAANKNSAVLLDGYIEIHKQSCNQEDCPLKQKVIKNNRFAKNLMSQDETMNEKYAVLIQLLYKMYTQAIKKFPNDTSLRIAYAFFLLEKMQSKQQALQELSQAEQNKPPFDQQFIVFRYKKLIEDEIAESQQDGHGGLDVVSEVAFQNHLRQLQANIEKSALLHMEFWSQLSEDNPDLSKLNDSGSKINSSVRNVEDHWNKLLKINANNAKAMRLYGKYLIEIINDKESGDLLLEKARSISNIQDNKKVLQMVGANGEDYSNDATPTVWVSGEQDKFGIITGINLAAASLFGYNKTELLTRKVNTLMPNTFSKHHDSFLENYLNTGEGSLIGKNKERFVFGKNKSNYIFPIYLSLRAIQSIIQGIQFIATFRVEKNFKNAAYILTHPDGTIDAISSSAISLLKVDLKTVSSKKTNIQDLVPNILRDKQNIFTTNNNTTGRSSAVIHYDYPRDSEYLLDNESPSINLNCYLNELIFLAGRENAGYQFKFERILDRTSMALQVDKKAKISNFQFKFDKTKASILGEYVEGSTTTDVLTEPVDEDLLNSLQPTEQNNSDNGRDNFNSAKHSQQDEEEEEVEKKNYGLGIKTLRLFNGKPQEIEDKENSEEDEDEEKFDKQSSSKEPSQNKQQEHQEEDLGEDGSYRDFSTTFKSKKALSAVVNDKTPPSSIKSLRWTVNMLGIVLFVIALLDYVFARKEFNTINKDIELFDTSNLLIAHMMTALSKVRDLALIGRNLLDNDPTVIQNLQNDLNAALNSAKTYNEYLQQEVSSLSDEHSVLYNSKSIPLSDVSSGEPAYHTLPQATEQIISRGFALALVTPSDMITSLKGDPKTTYSADYYFVTYNLLNEYYMGLQRSSQLYAEKLNDRVSGKFNSFLILLIASILALILAMLILFPILYQVKKVREEVLSLFLDIPEKTVKGLYNKCETFISNLQVGEDEDIVSEIDDEELDHKQNENEHEQQDFIPRRRRKRFKNSTRNNRAFFFYALCVACLIEAYFIYAFVSASITLSNIKTLIPELNSTSVAEGFFSFANNAERQSFLTDAQLTVLGEDAKDVAATNIKLMYDLDSLILEEHSINRKIHSDTYADVFNNIMMSSPCDYIAKANVSVDNATCAAFADQTVYQGMTVALSRHFENLRTLQSCNSKLVNNQACSVVAQGPKDDTDLGLSSPTDDTLIDQLNLLRTNQSYEITLMQDKYIKVSFNVLMTSFKQSIEDSFNNVTTIRLVVFIVFIVVIVSIYILLWQTVVRNISNDIWRTKSMLNMIPLNVIAKIKSIRLYLKRFWNERNLSQY